MNSATYFFEVDQIRLGATTILEENISELFNNSAKFPFNTSKFVLDI